MVEVEPSARDVEAAPPADGLDRGRIRRTAPLMKLTTRTLMGAAVAGLRGRLSGSDGDDFHARTEDSYYELLGDSKGVLRKAGQMLSFLATDSVVPREFQPTYRAAFRLQGH